MFISVSAFLKVWEQEVQATQKLLNALTNDSLKQAITVEDRTLGRIAWHLVTTIPEMMSRTGLTFESTYEDALVPSSVKEIINTYLKVSTTLSTSIKTLWTDQTLLEERDMYGETWLIGATLSALVDHQIHHRGQMTVLMRQAGLKVPGIYGPAREDWAQHGMKPPLV